MLKRFISAFLNKGLVFGFLLLAVSSITVVHAQAILSGVIKNEKSNEVLEGATIFLIEYTRGTYADESGKFSFSNLKPGKYSLVCSYIGYKRDTITGIEVKAGKETTLEIFMISEGENVLEEVRITEVRTTVSEASLVTELKENDQVVSGVSAEQIRKGPDRDAAEVMRRLPGVTLTDDRFVMIRGLNERYNIVLLNGGPAPGSEADSKAFSFDLIPSGMISRIMVTKTPAPEFPGEVAGGVIQVQTQSMPDKNLFQFGYSLGIRQYTTGQDFSSGLGSPSDFLGFDNGRRNLPVGFPSHLNTVNSANDLNAVSTSMNNLWEINTSSGAPDMRLNASFAHKFDLKGLTLGTTSALTYSNTLSHTRIDRYNYNAYNNLTKTSDTIYHYIDNQYNRNARIGLMSNWSLLFPSGHLIEWRNLLNQSGLLSTTERSGVNQEEGSEVRNYSLGWQERSLYSTQLMGKHPLKKDIMELEWQGGYSINTRREPDLRRLRTIRPIGGPDSVRYQTVIPPSASTLDASRFYSDNQEEIISGKLELSNTLKVSDNKELKIKIGVWAESKTRDFSARWMSYKKANTATFDASLLYLPLDNIFSPQNINSTNGFVLTEGTNPSDTYSASNQNIAGFISARYPLLKWVTLQGGLRAENNVQKLSSRDYNNNSVEVNTPQFRLLPSGGITFQPSPLHFIRLLGGVTLNRPEFRELAPFAYYDFAFNNVLYGNPALKTPYIQNADLRWEFYPTLSEFIHAGIFYKHFQNPIEQFFVPGTGSGGTRNFTFTNAASAQSVGFETEVRKSFKDLLPVPIIRDLNLVVNLALIHTEVNLGDSSSGQKQIRPMQGQAPYVVNGGLFYRADSIGLQVMALYNVFGKRLFAVGTFGTPDIYEMPRHQLDVTISKSLGKYTELRFAVQDLLNSRYFLQQDSNEDGTIAKNEEKILTTRRGRYTTLSISFRF
jgi:TonB-dependent receptor